MTQRQSIQSLYIIFIAICFLVVMLLGLINIKNSYATYQRSSELSHLHVVIDHLFNAVRNFGFERGRVNVVLNYQKNPNDMSKNIQFFLDRRKEGETSIDKALEILSFDKKLSNHLYVKNIFKFQSHVKELRAISDTEIYHSYNLRNREHPQLWFDAMSNYIRSIIQLSSFLVTNIEVIDTESLHLLKLEEHSMKLRDHAGPVCSYLAAAILSPDKFSDKRKDEIIQRDALARLEFERIKELSTTLNLDSINEQVNKLNKLYYIEFQKIINSTLQSLQNGVPLQYSQKQFTQKAVQSLEMIAKLHKVAQQHSKSHLSHGKKKALMVLTVNILMLLFILSIFIYSIYTLQKKIYAPIFDLSAAMRNLVSHTDITQVDIPENDRNDEIGDLEQLLKEFKQNKLSLIHEKERFEKMFQTHSAILIIVDPVDGKIVDYNEAAKNMYGYTYEEMKELTIFDINEMDKDDIYRTMKNVSKEKEKSFKFSHVKKDRSKIYVEVFSTPFTFNDKQLLFSIIHDITGRFEQERRIQDYQKQLENLNLELSDRVEIEVHERITQNLIFKQIFNSLDNFVSLLDKDYQYVIVNDTYCEKFGLSKNDIIGTHVSQVVSEEVFQQKVKGQLDRAISGEIVTLETYLPIKDERIFVQTVFCPFMSSEGTVDGIIVSSRDITEVHNLEIELQNKEQLMIQQSKLADMGAMISAITHQWKQPLNIIGLVTQMFQMKHEDDKDVAELVDSIDEQIQYMSTTVNDFRDLYSPSKIKKIFDVNDSIKKVVHLLFPKINTLNIEIKIDETLDATAYGLRNEFIQVMMNLINNAKDAILDKDTTGGLIEIKTERIDDGVKVTVKDNGGGIPQELLPDKLFEQFVTTKGEKGTGIGLSMSKNLIEQFMEGSLTVSNAGDGALFTIMLPSKKIEMSARQKEDTTILFVEDDDYTRTETFKLLSHKFDTVITAKDGEEGLQLFNENIENIAIVITDIDMPVMNGVKMSEKIREVSPSIPIVVLTAIKQDVFHDIGFNDIFEKPLNLNKLIECIYRLT